MKISLATSVLAAFVALAATSSAVFASSVSIESPEEDVIDKVLKEIDLGK